MAYLKELRGIPCNTGTCLRQAVVEAYDNRNNPAGRYCRKCGNRQLIMLKREV